MPSGMTLDAIHAVLASEPATLLELETALGFSLARDARSEEAWIVLRKAPAAGIASVYAGFVGQDLHSNPDPMLDELRLCATEIDCRAEAVAVIGAGEQRGGEEATYDIHHETPPWAGGPKKTVPISHAWSRARGLLEIHQNAKQIYWTRHEEPFAEAWSPEEPLLVLSRLSSLLAQPVDEAGIEQAFGKLVMSGRGPVRFLRGSSWKLEVKPIEGPNPNQVDLLLRPSLPVDAVLKGLGWPPMLVCTSGVYMASAHVVDPTTRAAPVLHGSRVEIQIASTRDGTRSPVTAPAQRVYETTNLFATRVHIHVGSAR